MDDRELARTIAETAGNLLLSLREQHTGSTAELRAVGDARSQSLTAHLLRRHRPDDAVLSEEAADSPARLDADRVWIIDPLDGTREFAEPPREDWAVHVALWERGTLTAGAVALPARGKLLSADRRPPAAPARSGPPRMLVSRTRPPAIVGPLAAALGADRVPQGSAGAKVADVLLGAADLYVHAGGQYEWDSAAPVAIARAWGFHAARLDGTPLVYNRPDPLLPDLVVCRPELAERFHAAHDAITGAMAPTGRPPV